MFFIDVQNRYSSKNPRTTRAIQQILPSVRKSGLRVLWTYMDRTRASRQPGSVSDAFCSQSFFENVIQPTILPEQGEHVSSKGDCDAFTNPALADFLKERGILHLILAGFMGFDCVRLTAEGALRNGFKTSVAVPLTADIGDVFSLHRFGHEGTVHRLDQNALEETIKQPVNSIS